MDRCGLPGLREALNEKQWTLSDLSEALASRGVNLSTQALSNYSNSQRDTVGRNIVLIAELLSCTTDRLLGVGPTVAEDAA